MFFMVELSVFMKHPQAYAIGRNEEVQAGDAMSIGFLTLNPMSDIPPQGVVK